MNTWGYLILIAALLAVATLMLYARFSSRSREKSLHHGLDGIFSGGTDTMAPSVPDVVAVGEEIVEAGSGEFGPHDAAVAIDADASEARGLAGSSEGAPEPPTVRAEVISAPEPEASPESSYMDELQEAAAGLAKLMRSSPLTTRAEPVVFAPEEGFAESEDAPSELSVDALLETGSSAEELDVPVARESEAAPAEGGDLSADGFEADGERAGDPVERLAETEGAAEIPSLDAPSLAEDAGAGDPTPSLVGEGACDPPSRLTLLGEAVCAELERIDAGLDSLEELVVGMESSLAVWAEEGQENEVAFGSEELVEKAA